MLRQQFKATGPVDHEIGHLSLTRKILSEMISGKELLPLELGISQRPIAKHHSGQYRLAFRWLSACSQLEKSKKSSLGA